MQLLASVSKAGHELTYQSSLFGDWEDCSASISGGLLLQKLQSFERCPAEMRITVGKVQRGGLTLLVHPDKSLFIFIKHGSIFTSR